MLFLCLHLVFFYKPPRGCFIKFSIKKAQAVSLFQETVRKDAARQTSFNTFCCCYELGLRHKQSITKSKAGFRSTGSFQRSQTHRIESPSKTCFVLRMNELLRKSSLKLNLSIAHLFLPDTVVNHISPTLTKTLYFVAGNQQTSKFIIVPRKQDVISSCLSRLSQSALVYS